MFDHVPPFVLRARDIVEDAIKKHSVYFVYEGGQTIHLKIACDCDNIGHHEAEILAHIEAAVRR